MSTPQDAKAPVPFSPRSVWEADEFLDAFAAWYFPGATSAFLECEGITVRGLHRQGRAAAGIWHFRSDFEPVDSVVSCAVTVPLIPDVALRVRPLGGPPLPPRVAPLVRWQPFVAWEDYQRHIGGRPDGAGPRVLAKKRRRLERSIGEFAFDPGGSDHAALTRLIDWKNRQLELRHEQNRFSIRRNQLFLHELLDRRVFKCATLHAGGELFAGILWGRAAGRMTIYLSAYDATQAYFSPGSILLEQLLRFSFESGDTEFDFMAGLQPYKLAYATHLRELRTIGREPLRDRTARVARHLAGETLLRVPAVKRRARQAEAALRGRIRGRR